MRKKRLFSAAAISVSMALSLSACVVKDGKIETNPTSQTTTVAVKDTEDATSPEESSEEVTTADVISEPVSEEETQTVSEESTEKDTEEVTDEVSTEEESTEENTTPEETTAEEDPTPEETTTPESTTPEPTTPEPTTPEPTTEQLTTPEPLIVETTTTKEPETKVELVSIKAEVKGTHYIGDTLTGNDFVVTGTYSDGHTESLNGWGADPLKLTSAETKITVSKGTVKTVITVKAQEKPAATVASVSATVSGTHYIGDTLSGSDFTVTVKMSDGSTLTNPAGWSAAPLKLDSASTNVTVTYGGVSIVVTVNASARPAQPVVNDNLGTVYTGDEMLAYIWHTFIERNYLFTPSMTGGGNLYINKVYTYNNPYTCSTFVQTVFKKFGMDIPSDIASIYNLDKTSPNVKEVPISEAKTGDIAVYSGPMGGGLYMGHCGIVVDYLHTGVYVMDCTPENGIGTSNWTNFKILRFSGNTLVNTLKHENGDLPDFYRFACPYSSVPDKYETTYILKKVIYPPSAYAYNSDVTVLVKVDKNLGITWRKYTNIATSKTWLEISVLNPNFGYDDITFPNPYDYPDIDGTTIEAGEYEGVSATELSALRIKDGFLVQEAIYPQYEIY